MTLTNGISNIEEILERLGVEVDEDVNHKGWTNGLCPLHFDHTNSFSINLETGGWVCHKFCGRGKLDSLISRINNCSITEARKWIEMSSEPPPVEASELMNLLYSTLNQKPEEKQEKIMEAYRTDIGPKFLLQRGFTKKTLQEWKIGYDPEKGAAIIPVLDRWVIRRFSPETLYLAPAKYVYEPDFPKSEILFGLDHCTDSSKVVVVEGSLDCIWLHQCGVKSAVAILGAHVSDQQRNQLLSKFDKVYFMLDNDEAGIAGMREVLQDPRFLSSKVVTLPTYRKDPQECNKAEIVASLVQSKDAVKWLLGI